MTTKTIGSGGDYGDIKAWRDACPDLVATTQTWRGELKSSSSPYTLTAGITFAGLTTSSTYYIELTTQAGASFIDNASASSNALRFNSSNGVVVQTSTAWVDVFTSGAAFVKLSKLQIAATHNNSNAIVQSSTGVFQINQCIIEGKGSTYAVVQLYGSSCYIANSLVLNRRSSSTGACVKLSSGANAYNCTFAATVSAGANALSGSYTPAPVVKNCAIFNYTAIKTGGNTPTYTTCGTDIASPPSGFTGSLTYSSQFESVTDGTHDFRLKSGSSLIDVGTTDSTYAANDIINTSRPSGSAYDIGAWEYVSAGGGGLFVNPLTGIGGGAAQPIA